MNHSLKINDRLRIARDLIKTTAVRSSGPGGQNVNKVATCIEIRFNPRDCEDLSKAVTQRLMKLAGKRIDSEGSIIITSQKYREQYRNLQDALGKLRSMILKALKPPKPRKPTSPTRGSIERRLKQKRVNAAKKASRQKPTREDFQ